MIKKELIEEKVVSLLTKQLLNNETIDTIVNNVNNEYKK